MAEVSFGEWLKRRRNTLGLTQEQLALQIHCSTSALRKFESEERRPSAEVVEQLAHIFNIPPEEHESFLRFARGDWQAFAGGDTDEAPWRLPILDEPSNLPSFITSFIGREQEQEEVINLLKKNRLVTIVGVGGIGKTRLAAQVGNRLLADYPHGVWFIPLDSLSDPLLVPQTAAAAFDIREMANRPIMETLKQVLRTKTLLLILDNCEHLLDACTQFSATLLTRCPNLRILTTSREIMNMPGEVTYFLPSLSMPTESAAIEQEAEYESVRLFVERAGLALSTFRLDRTNSQFVLDICRSADGIPLAIELTAARVNILSVEEISKQLHQSFDLLASDQRTTLSRHQTLQMSLDWSWSLLSDSEQVFLRQLSVFAGGNVVEARQAAEPGLQLARSLSDRQNEALGLLFLGRSIALAGDYQEGFPLIEQSLAIYQSLGDQIGQATATGWLGMNHNDLEHSKAFLSKSLKLHRELGNLSGMSWCLTFLGYHAIFGRDFSSSASWLEEAKTLYHQLGDQPNEADVLQMLGMLAHWQGNYQKACTYFEQSIAMYEKSGGYGYPGRVSAWHILYCGKVISRGPQKHLRFAFNNSRS